MKKKDKSAERTRRYRERLIEKREAAAEEASEKAKCVAQNLCGFAETGYKTPAQTCADEIRLHRSFLRALDQRDILPNETLRELARRTWNALLNSKSIGVWL